MTSYDVQPAQLDAFAKAAADDAEEFYKVGLAAQQAALPAGAVGRVRGSEAFEGAYDGFLKAVVMELSGAALGAAYFSDATSGAAEFYRQTDLESSQLFEAIWNSIDTGGFPTDGGGLAPPAGLAQRPRFSF